MTASPIKTKGLNELMHSSCCFPVYIMLNGLLFWTFYKLFSRNLGTTLTHTCGKNLTELENLMNSKVLLYSGV